MRHTKSQERIRGEVGGLKDLPPVCVHPRYLVKKGKELWCLARQDVGWARKTIDHDEWNPYNIDGLLLDRVPPRFVSLIVIVHSALVSVVRLRLPSCGV